MVKERDVLDELTECEIMWHYILRPCYYLREHVYHLIVPCGVLQYYDRPGRLTVGRHGFPRLARTRTHVVTGPHPCGLPVPVGFTTSNHQTFIAICKNDAFS